MTGRPHPDWSAATLNTAGTLVVPLVGAVADPYYFPAMREVFSQWEGGQRNDQTWQTLEAYPDRIIVGGVTASTSPEDLHLYVEQGLESATRIAPSLAQADEERKEEARDAQARLNRRLEELNERFRNPKEQPH